MKIVISFMIAGTLLAGIVAFGAQDTGGNSTTKKTDKGKKKKKKGNNGPYEKK